MTVPDRPGVWRRTWEEVVSEGSESRTVRRWRLYAVHRVAGVLRAMKLALPAGWRPVSDWTGHAGEWEWVRELGPGGVEGRDAL